MGELQTDPSMEDILASIKRVIAEDGRAAAPARPRRAMPDPVETAASEDEEDVLELDDPVTEHSGLLSSDVAAASRKRLAALSTLRGRSDPAPDMSPLDAVVREMLRPMLKEWLDENLPEIVESLVTREIARITGRSL